jgi:hypothetical protein
LGASRLNELVDPIENFAHLLDRGMGIVYSLRVLHEIDQKVELKT